MAADPTPLETVDLLIVGAGFHGLSLAATYTTTHPSASLLIIDAAPSIGGVWAQSRLYPGLKTNSQAGHFEFADYPMLGNPRYPEVRADEHIAGDSVRRYLEDYAAEKGLVGRVRCGRKVVEAEDLGAEGWVVSVEEVDEGEGGGDGEKKGENRTQKIHARILVLATGLTSTPKPPSSLLKCADTSAFTGPIYHVRDFGKHCPSSPSPAATTTDEKKKKKKTILILSANKSAADCAHHHAHTLGNRVIWLIRPSGHGPCFLAPARVTPLKLLSEALITTRAVTFLNPCIWAAANPSSPSPSSPSSPSRSSTSTSASAASAASAAPRLSFNHFERLCRTLLHRTPAGRALVRAFHAQLVQRKGVEEPLRLDAHPQTALLRPWHDAFWVGTGRGLLNWGGAEEGGAPDVFELVRRGKIEVRVGEVVGMEGGAVKLSGGEGEDETVEVDEVVCSAGWEYRPSVRLVRGGVDISAELGVPGAGGREDKVAREEEEDEAALVARADEEILTALPGLREQPPQGRPPHLRGSSSAAQTGTERQKKKTLDDAYALYRFMIPPRRIHTRTLAFAGVVRTPVTATIAEMQALWLCAFFDHRLPHLEPSTIPPSPSSLKPDAAPSPKLSTPAVEKGPEDVKMHGDQQDEQQQQRAMSEISARVRYDAILHARYGAWRYPAGFGGVLPDFFFDTLPLFDLMLAELGLPRWRKGGFVKEVFSSYGPHDYSGLVEEWMELWKDGRGGRRVGEGFGMGTAVVVCVALLLWVVGMALLMRWVWSGW